MQGLTHVRRQYSTKWGPQQPSLRNRIGVADHTLLFCLPVPMPPTLGRNVCASGGNVLQ
jgi:hypothetical protein